MSVYIYDKVVGGIVITTGTNPLTFALPAPVMGAIRKIIIRQTGGTAVGSLTLSVYNKNTSPQTTNQIIPQQTNASNSLAFFAGANVYQYFCLDGTLSAQVRQITLVLTTSGQVDTCTFEIGYTIDPAVPI